MGVLETVVMTVGVSIVLALMGFLPISLYLERKSVEKVNKKVENSNKKCD